MQLPQYLVTAAVAIILLALSLIGVLAHLLWPNLIAQNIGLLSDVLHHAGAAGWIALTILNIFIVASGLLPASLFGILAGAVYGAYFGFALSATSTMVGALLSFWFSRSMFHPAFTWILRRNPKIKNIDVLIAADGWKTVFLLRLSPILPFAATSYCLGLSSIGQRDYLLGTLASLPSLFGCVLIGVFAHSTVSDLNLGSTLSRTGLLGFGAVVILLAVAHIGRLIKQAGAGAIRDQEK